MNFQIFNNGPPVGKPIHVTFASDKKVQSSLAAKSFIELLEKNPRIKDITTDIRGGKKELQVVPNYQKLARLGLDATILAHSLRLAFDGESVVSERYDNENVDFKLSLSIAKDNPIDILNTIRIPNRNGQLISLSQVAQIKKASSASSISHYNGQPSVTVEADLADSSNPQTVVDEALTALNAEKLFPDTKVVIGGQAEETRKAIAGQIVSFIFSILGIYCILVVFLNSLSQPIIILMTIPLGLFGIVFIFIFNETPFSFAAMLGAVGLLGIIVNDSLVMVNRLNALQKDSSFESLKQLISIGSSERLRAIFLTTITTLLGLFPLALGIGGTDPFMSPMALSMGAGLVTGTILTIFFVPCFYAIHCDLFKKKSFGINN